MRKIVQHILFIVLALVCACSQDLGNYDYINLDEPAISGLADQEVFTLSRLKITPQIDGGDFSDEEYTFEWMVLDQNSSMEPVIIGTERELDYEVTLAPGAYSLYFTITETKTGLYWRAEANLTVSSSMSEGWMVLCCVE